MGWGRVFDLLAYSQAPKRFANFVFDGRGSHHVKTTDSSASAAGHKSDNNGPTLEVAGRHRTFGQFGVVRSSSGPSYHDAGGGDFWAIFWSWPAVRIAFFFFRLGVAGMATEKVKDRAIAALVGRVLCFGLPVFLVFMRSTLSNGSPATIGQSAQHCKQKPPRRAIGFPWTLQSGEVGTTLQLVPYDD